MAFYSKNETKIWQLYKLSLALSKIFKQAQITNIILLKSSSKCINFFDNLFFTNDIFHKWFFDELTLKKTGKGQIEFF